VCFKESFVGAESMQHSTQNSCIGHDSQHSDASKKIQQWVIWFAVLFIVWFAPSTFLAGAVFIHSVVSVTEQG